MLAVQLFVFLFVDTDAHGYIEDHRGVQLNGGGKAFGLKGVDDELVESVGFSRFAIIRFFGEVSFADL